MAYPPLTTIYLKTYLFNISDRGFDHIGGHVCIAISRDSGCTHMTARDGTVDATALPAFWGAYSGTAILAGTDSERAASLAPRTCSSSSSHCFPRRRPTDMK